MFIKIILLLSLGIPWFAFGCNNQQDPIGCFSNKHTNVMKAHSIRSNEMTICYCIEHCRDQGYTFSGLKNGDRCSCGNEYATLKKRKSCNKACKGNRNIKCGGRENIQIHSTELVFEDEAMPFVNVRDKLSYLSSSTMRRSSFKNTYVVAENTVYAYSDNSLECDDLLDGAPSISLQVSSNEEAGIQTRLRSSSSEFLIAVGNKNNQNNATILVPILGKNEDDGYTNYMISGILSAVVYDSDGNVQQAQIKFSIETSKPASVENGKKICTFLTDDNGKWSSYGCITTVMNENVTSCSCNHTTSFAVLLQVQKKTISEYDTATLDALSFGGLVLSSVCILATIVVTVALKQIRISERGIIHLNLSSAMFIGQITFLLGIDQTESEITCKIVAFMLHFSYLAVFAWMVLEATYLYYKIINKALNSVGTKARYVIVATAWGFPAIIAGLTMLTDDEYLQLSACWLSYENDVIWAFIVPVIIIVLINSVIMAMVVRVMWQRARTHDASNPNFKRLRVSVRGMLILLPLLGLTWAFGLLALGDAAVAMQYLFVICNTLQGTFIFINFCLVDHEVRKLVIGIYGKCSTKKNTARVDPSGTTTTSNT